MAEYTLNFTGAEIDERLAAIGNIQNIIDPELSKSLVLTWNGYIGEEPDPDMGNLITISNINLTRQDIANITTIYFNDGMSEVTDSFIINEDETGLWSIHADTIDSASGFEFAHIQTSEFPTGVSEIAFRKQPDGWYISRLIINPWSGAAEGENIQIKATALPLATPTSSGAMSKDDKIKLDALDRSPNSIEINAAPHDADIITILNSANFIQLTDNGRNYIIPTATVDNIDEDGYYRLTQSALKDSRVITEMYQSSHMNEEDSTFLANHENMIRAYIPSLRNSEDLESGYFMFPLITKIYYKTDANGEILETLGQVDPSILPLATVGTQGVISGEEKRKLNELMAPQQVWSGSLQRGGWDMGSEIGSELKATLEQASKIRIRVSSSTDSRTENIDLVRMGIGYPCTFTRSVPHIGTDYWADPNKLRNTSLTVAYDEALNLSGSDHLIYRDLVHNITNGATDTTATNTLPNYLRSIYITEWRDVEMATFYVDTPDMLYDYLFEEGMTFHEWVSSGYNYQGFYREDNNSGEILYQNKYLLNENGDRVSDADLVDSTQIYTLS